MTVAPINYLNNKLGITDDKETARINAKINSGEGIDLGLPKSYVDEGDQSGGIVDKATSVVSGLAKIAPAIITAGDSGGASFFLQGTGQAAENIAKAKANGVKFNNHADDMFILGSGIINYALGKSVSGTVMNKLAPGLQNDIVGGLAAEATKGLGQLGADATAKDVANYYTQTAMNFGQRLQQYGLGVLKTLPTNMTDFATANLLGSGLKAATNKLSGNNPMGDVSGNEIVKDISSSLDPAIGASVAHGVLTGGMLFDKSPYMNPVIESLQKDNSPEGVQRLQDQIATIGKNRSWTDDEISKTQEAIHGLSDIVNTLPSDLPPDKFHEAVTTIMDRGKLQNISNEIESRKANYDSAISGKAAPFEDMVNAQKDKLNDKLVGLFTDQPYHYFEKDGEFFKQHGYEDPEQISKARWDLENLENDNQPKSAQSDVYEEPVKEGETNKAPEPEAAEQTAPPKEPFAPKATPAPQEPTDMMDDLDKELEAFKQQSSPTPAEPIVNPTAESDIKTTENEIKSTESEINKEEPTDAVPEQTARKMGIFDQPAVGEGMGEQNGSEQPAAKSNASEPIQTNEEEPLSPEKLEGRIESKQTQIDNLKKNVAEIKEGPKKETQTANINNQITESESQLADLKKQQSDQLEASLPKNKPYYVNMPQGHVEIPGKPMANDHGLDLFSHNMEAINGKGYGVSEGSTGLSIGKGKTEEDAIANAKQNLSTKTPAEMQAIIKKQHEAGTKSPRGIIQPGSTDTAHTEDVIAKATTTLGKAKAASGGTVKSAGIIDAIDESVKELDKEIKDAGGDPNAKQEDEEPDNEPPKGDKKAEREAKKAKVKERLDKAKKEFLDSVRKYTNAGIHPETLAKGLQMMKAYADAGLLKFSEIAEDLADEIGENLRDVFAALKASYLAYGAEATDEEAEQMDDTKAVRKANIDDYLTKKEENGSASKPVTVDENTSAVDEGKPAGKPTGNEQQRGAAELPATENGGSSAVGSKTESTGNEPGRSGQPGSGNDTGTGGKGTKRGLQQPDNGSAVQPNTTERTIAPENQNHVIKPGDTIVPTGTVGKFNANADALFLLKKLEAENRNPTPAEKQQLARFTGWGGLAKYLSVPNYKDGEAVSTVMNGGKTQLYNNSYQPVRLDFTNEGPIDLAKYDNMNELVNHVKQQLANAGYSIAPDAIRAPLLKAMLSNNEYQAAQSSTVTAYYTEQRVINSMWNIVKKLGFTGGRALESSAGIGHILGLIPKELRNKTALTAYELDNVTGRMLKKLYPQANITVGGFEAARVPNNSQDLVITNVPFGQTAPYDKNFPELSKFSLHNYFIGKNLKLLKPGGVAMIITSSSTMDAANSGKFREWVNSPEGGNSYLVGAIRLPSNVFDENAGTQVTSDILVFQKRNQNNDSSLEQPFRYSKQFAEGTNSNGETVPIDVNEYYHEHPENMLGTMMTANDAGTGNRYGDGSNATLKAADNFDLQKSLDKAEKSFPSGIIGNVKESTENVAEPITAIDKKEGSLFVKGDKIYKVQDGDGIPVPMDAKQQAITKAYVPLKEGLLNLIRLEQSPVNAEANIDAQRKELNKDYDAFVKKYGNINSRTTNFLSDADIDFPIVSSLENVARSLNDNNRIIETITKGDILTKRINFPRTEPTTATDMKDAINISLNYRTGLDLNYMARMLGKDVDELKQELLSNELAYENPDTGILETPEEYLSGFVRDKLRKAEVAAVNDPAFKKNVAELKKVIPEDIPSSLISYSLGSSWIPDYIYEQFAKDIFEGANVDVKYLDKAGKYLVTPGYGTRNAAVNDTYAAGGMNGVQILDGTLNNRQIIVNDTFKDPDTGSTKTVKNVEKTAAAQGMQAMLQERFEQYVKSNEPVQRETERIYNDVYNGQVLRNYRLPDFKYYPGASHTIELREHQKKSVSRALSDSTLHAHEVGSGKTFSLITTAMEMRRLGTARKPMIGVQNSTFGDFVADFKKLYPSAKILAPNEKEMSADGRRKLFAKIATGDWDAIILPHSQISMIPDDPERQKAYINEQIEEMKETMASIGDKREANKFKTEINKLQAEIEAIDNPKGASAKSIGKKSMGIEKQIKKALDRKTDNILNFEQLGVDALLMDESHKFKRLGFSTNMQNIKGIDTSRSQRSQSVLLKARWVQEKTGGKNVNFYTGTPISNTMAEAWTMMKYLRPDILAHMGIEYFDQFAKTFGQVIPSLEQTGGGTFKIQNRFAKFQNLPEFITSFRAVTDVVLTDDVKEFQNTDTIPKLKDGKFTQVILPQSPELKKQIQEFKNTLDWFDKLSGREKKENSHIPLVIYNKAKQASIDLRLLSPTNVDSPQSKVNAAVDNAYTIYKETGGKKGVQMIFSDMYQSPEPKNQFLDEDGRIVNPAYGQARFNLFEDIKRKLIAKGVPADQIVIFTESKYDNALKKKAVFADANSGKIRFLLGTTEKMGVGVNAQQKLVALHHLDAPARPMDFEQRNGRIIRQGNENKIVDVLTYGVEKTLDSSAFQRLSTKQKFINQIMKGQNLERVTEDPADESQMTFDEMMAHLSDSPYAMQKLMVDNKLQTEKMKRENFNDKLIKTNSTLRRTESELKANKATISDEIKNAEAVRKDFPDGNISTFQRKGEEPVTEKFGEAADKYVQQLITNFENSPTNYAKGGFELNGHRVELEIKNYQKLSKETGLVVNTPELHYTMPDIGLMTDRYGNPLHIQSNSGTGLLSSIRSQLDRTLVKPSETQQSINKNEKDIETLKKNAEEKFDDSKLKSLQEESEALKQKMLIEKKEPEPDDDGPDGGQSPMDYIKDQSNIKKGLDFLDSLKAKPGGQMMSTIIPIPPAVWNGAIDVMKNMLKATNSSQKAIRVAAKYIMDKGGSSAQAKDFEATMKEKLAQSKNASAANVPDTDEVLTEDGMVKAATVLQEKLKGAELSPNEKDFASMDLTDMNKKELHRYIEVASVLSVDPQGVLSSDVQDVQNRVNNRKNPKMGTAVPPPTEPPTDTTLPGDEEEPIKPRGTIPKKEKIPMESVEELPEQTDENGKPIAKENYSALGRIKDIRVRNLEQLKQFGKDIGDFTALRDVRQYATSKSQSSIVMKTATDRILKIVGKPGWDVLREALVESRLRGIRERWDNWSQQIKDSSDHDIDELFQDGKESVMYDVINKLEGYDDDANPAQTILGLISNGEYDDAREYMSDMFKNAATNVAYFDKLSNGKTFDDMVKDGKFVDPKMQEAFEAYKSLMAKPFEESHASNEGVFSDALGPLDTYYPLTPVGKDKHFIAGTPKYKAPENPNNKFATGQGDKYSTELSDLSNKLANAIRTNNKANAIKALENAGLIAKVSKDDPDSGYISVNGQLYTAVKVKTGDSMLVNNNGKTVQIPARYVMMPKWLYREVKPIFEDTGSLADDFSLLGRINDVGVKLMLGGPLEAIGHSYRLLGGILNSMPYMQEWAYKNGVLGHAGGLALNNPFVKIWAGMGKIVFSDINSEEALQQIQEMAKIGIIPEKTWQKTWSKEFAELTGAKKVPIWDWSPILYGKKSLDLKARVTLYRLSKAMNPNATPEELVKMQNELGNYTMSLQGDLEKFVKHHGLAPFYSFGGAIYRSGVKSVLGQSDLPMTRPSMKDAFTNGTDAKTFAKYSAYKMAQLLSAGIMGLIGYWALTYKSETDKWPWEDKHSKLLKVPFPEWAKNDLTKNMWTDQGQYRDMDFAFLNPFVNRGVRALGLQKAYESNQLGGTAGQTVEAGAIQAINTNLSPYTSSPALNLGVTAITGDAPYITGIRDKYAGTPGISLYRKVNTFSPGYQIPANIATGVLGMNPLVDDVFSPVTKALKYKYSADDQDAYSAMSGVVNMMFPRLFSPHGSDEKKEALMKKQQKAIQTSIKKEKVKEGR